MEKFIEELEKNKITIIRTWISYPFVLQLLKDYSIDENLFIRRYSFAVLEHFIQLTKKDEKTEKNSLVIDFLKYLKKLNLKINELFLLFSAFRDSLVDFSFEKELYSKELIKNVESFDIEKVDYLMNTYLELIENLKAKLGN